MMQALAPGARWRPLRVWWRRNWFYRRLLRGPLGRPHSSFIPMTPGRAGWKTPTPCCAGRFRFDGENVDVPDGISVFDMPPPSQAWAGSAARLFLAGRRCRMAGGEAARLLATNLIAPMDQAPRPLFRAGLVAACHGAAADASFSAMSRLVIANSDMTVALQAVRQPARAGADAGAHLRRSARRPAAAGSRGGAGAVGRLPGRLSRAPGIGPGAAGSWKSSARSCPMAAMSTARRKTCCRPIAISSW